MNEKITLKQFFDSEKPLAIRCKTEDEALKLLTEFDRLGKTFFDDVPYTAKTFWREFKENTMYTNKGYIDEYSNLDISFYYKIYEYEDVILYDNQLERKDEKYMDNKNFEQLCVQAVVEYFNSHVEKKDNKKITEDDVHIVWICKTLQNNKALVSTTVTDGLYYEITRNGDKNETYVDVYKKWENYVIK